MGRSGARRTSPRTRVQQMRRAIRLSRCLTRKMFVCVCVGLVQLYVMTQCDLRSDLEFAVDGTLRCTHILALVFKSGRHNTIKITVWSFVSLIYTC